MPNLDSELGKQSHGDIEAVERLYATGSTCDTYLVRVFGKLHFLKRLKAELAAQPRYVLAFRKEFETGFALDHPALPRYVALQGEHQRPAIVEEYVEGKTLTEFLHEQPDYFRNHQHARKFVAQLLSVLGYLHQHQILFLDLKPDNILITDIGHDVRLVDLGFCYTPGFNDTAGLTPDFASPEQLQGKNVDERTDIYLLGRVLQYCHVPHIYNNVVKRCAAPDAADRYANIDEVAVAVKHAERRPMLLATVVCSVLLLLALVAIILLPHRNTQSPTEQLTAKAVVEKQTATPTANATKDTRILSPDKATPTTSKPSATKASKPSASSSTKGTSAPSEKDRMIADIHRQMDAIYATTLKQFEDKDEISGIAFSAPFEEYRRRTEQLKHSMAKAHPSVSPTTISSEVDKYTSKIVYPIASKVVTDN